MSTKRSLLLGFICTLLALGVGYWAAVPAEPIPPASVEEPVPTLHEYMIKVREQTARERAAFEAAHPPREPNSDYDDPWDQISNE